MGKLVLSRRPGESIKISIDPDSVNVEALVTAFTNGISVTLAEIGYGQVRLLVEAPSCIRVDRAEWEAADAFHARAQGN
jgi:sRNA-binding carbon storage regulator CsrA